MLKRIVPLAFCLLLACAGILTAAEAPIAAKPREFVLAETPQRVSLDPLHTFTSFESELYTAIYEGLVVANPLTLEPVPGVATSWDSSDNGRVWRFMLRPDAAFSNGDRLRAVDFVNSWLRMLDPANNAEYSFLFDVIKGAHAYRTGAEKDPSTVGIKAVADDVLQVELEAPSPHFLKLLTHISFLPLHPSLLHSTDWGGGATVIGNGPFVLKSRSDTEIVLAKSPPTGTRRTSAHGHLRCALFAMRPTRPTPYHTGRVEWVTLLSSTPTS